MRAVIYCRVSTKEQVENFSLETQERDCRAYCEREGLGVVQVFLEKGESAKTAKRTQLVQLMAFCRESRPRVTVLVVHSISRFSRDVGAHHQIRNVLLALGISLRSATEPVDSTPEGKFFENFLAGVAQYDNDVKARRTIRGMQEANSKGRWTWTAPIGYLPGLDKRAASLRLDPERADLVTKAFELAAEPFATNTHVLRTVTALGLRTRKGARLSAQTIGKVLSNPVYAGQLKNSKWNLDRQGDWEPIVSVAQFQQVQGRRFPTSKPRKNSSLHPDFPLRHFLTCGNCAKPLTGSHSTGRNTRYPYYHCAKCNRVRSSKTAVESAFVALLDELKPSARFLRFFRAVTLNFWNNDRNEAAEVRRAIEKRIAQLSADIDRLERAYLFDRTIDADSYQSQLQRLRAEAAVAQCELSDARYEELDVEGLLIFAEHVLGNISSLWTTASVGDRARLQRTLFPTGLTWDGIDFGTGANSSVFSWLQLISVSGSSVASPTIPSWNQIAEFLKTMQQLRDSTGFAA